MSDEKNQKARNGYKLAWSKENEASVKVKLSRKTDADLIRFLEAQPEKSAYIRRLIREDMARAAAQGTGEGEGEGE